MQHLQNYQPVSLLPICGKIFARIILKFIFKYLEKIAFSVQINLVFVHLTHVKTSYYQSFMTLKLILINIQLLGGMIFQKTLTKCGMQGFSYRGEWRESPHQPKLCSFLPTQKNFSCDFIIFRNTGHANFDFN